MALNLFDFIDSLLSWLETVSSSPWFYLVIFSMVLLDSVIPAVPSETAVILGGIAAAQGELSIVLVILISALGAYAGDSTAYLVGRRSETLIERWFFRGEKGHQRLKSAGEQIRKRGGLLLVTARFVPGGRTVLTISCGVTRQPFLAWFTKWDILAVIIWANYAGFIGFFFGDRFGDDYSKAFWWAFGAILSVTAVIEITRFVRERYKSKYSNNTPSSENT